MNILDIKKRIIYITAAIKNINIVAKNNHIKTDEELEAVVRQAIHFAIEDDMSSEEKMFITEAIRSVVFSTKHETIKSKSRLSFLTKPIRYVDIFENIKVKDKVDVEALHAPLIKHLATLDIEDIVKINVDVAPLIKKIETIKVIDSASFNAIASIYMEHYNTMCVLDETSMNIANSLYTIGISDKSFINDKVAFAKAMHNLISIDTTDTVSEEGTLDVVGTFRFTINSKIKSTSRLAFADHNLMPITVNDNLDVYEDVIIDKLNSVAIRIAEEFKMKSHLDIEISAITPIHFTITSLFKLGEQVWLSKLASNRFKIDSKFSTSELFAFSGVESNRIKINNTFCVSETAIIGMYTPALISDYENQTIGSFKNKEILDFKYIIK